MIWIFLRLFIGYGLQMFPWAFLCFYPFRDSLGVKRNFNSVLVIFISALDIIFSSVCCVLSMLCLKECPSGRGYFIFLV